MSGGSYDYLCFKIEDMATKMLESKIPYRRAFGLHLKIVAKAAHDIEWVDSADMDKGKDKASIMACIKKSEVLDFLIDDAITIRDNINALLAEIEEEHGKE